jgi:hypothetical protein
MAASPWSTAIESTSYLPARSDSTASRAHAVSAKSPVSVLQQQVGDVKGRLLRGRGETPPLAAVRVEHEANLVRLQPQSSPTHGPPQNLRLNCAVRAHVSWTRTPPPGPRRVTPYRVPSLPSVRLPTGNVPSTATRVAHPVIDRGMPS